MKKLKLALVASAVALSASGVVTAATDGTLGATSTGESIVTIIKQNAVQITNVGDISLGTHAALAADQSGSDAVCVFSSTGGYSVTATSANGTGAFSLNDGGTNDIAYTVTWQGAGAAVPLAEGTALIGQTGDSGSVNCSGGTNATFEVTVAAALFNAAAPGSYSDTLTLLVEPE